jgi:hypothetical protein
MATVPGQTLERGKGRTKSPRQSKNKTAIGKSTKSIAIKWWRICYHFMEREVASRFIFHMPYDSTLSIVMSARSADITMDKVELNR